MVIEPVFTSSWQRKSTTLEMFARTEPDIKLTREKIGGGGGGGGVLSGGVTSTSPEEAHMFESRTV